MALNADTLLDRLHLKQQVQKWRVIAIGIAVLAIVMLVERPWRHSPIEHDYVARLSIEGVIMEDRDRDELIEELIEDPKVKAVVVWLDTPGGSAVGGEELYLKLRDLSNVKPVVAVMRSLCASAGYMTAIGADHIIAREGTITGSIGVLIQAVEVTGLAEKVGVTPITIKSSPLKGTLSPLEKATPEGKESLQNLINDFYNLFVSMVAERRKLSQEAVLRIADGRVYSGRKALELKLIDEIGGEKEAMAWLEKNRNIPEGIEIKDVKPERVEDFFFSGSAESIITKFFPRASAKLDGLLAIWHPAWQLQ